MIKFLWGQNKLLFFLLSALASVALIIIGAYWLKNKPEGLIITSVCASYFAALCYEFLQTYFQFRNIISKRIKFCKFLGLDSLKGKIAIILPQHELSKVEKQAINEMGARSTSDYTDDVISMNAISDVKAAANIYSIFRELNLETPKIRSYTDFYDSSSMQKNDEWGRYDVIILIGIYSNELLQEIEKNSTESEKYFKVNPIPPENPDGEKKLFIRVDTSLDNIQDNYFRVALSPKTKSDPEAGLIAKLRYKGKKIFVIGGMTQTGTIAMGHHFRSKWEKIYNLFMNSSRLSEIPNFAIAFKVNAPKIKGKVKEYPKIYPIIQKGPHSIYNDSIFDPQEIGN